MSAVVFATAGNFGLSFILEVIAFLLVIGFIAKYVWPPLNRAMAKQLASITDELAAGARARAAAAELVEERRAALEAAKLQATEIVAQARRAAAALVTEGERAAAEEHRRALARADAEAESQLARLRSEVMDETGAVIVDAAERVVRAVLDENRHHRLIGEAIEATGQEVQA